MPTVESVYVKQLDMTQDLLNFFYAPDNWKEKWDFMRNKLEA